LKNKGDYLIKTPVKIYLKSAITSANESRIKSYLNTIENILINIKKYQKKQININIKFYIISHNNLFKLIRKYITNKKDLSPLTTPYYQSRGTLLVNDFMFINQYEKALAIHKVLEKRNKNINLEIITSPITITYVLRDLTAIILSYMLELMPLHASCLTISHNDKNYILIVIGYSGFGKTTIGNILKTSNKIKTCSDEYTFLSSKYIIPIPSPEIQCENTIIDLERKIHRLIISFIVPEIGRYRYDILELFPLTWLGSWYFHNVFTMTYTDIINLANISYETLINILKPYIRQ